MNQGDQTQVLTGPATDLGKQLKELRLVLGQLRGAGATADDCDVAEDAVAKIEGAMQKPAEALARKEAKGALATLKGLAEGFGTVEKIGGTFTKILGQLQPVLVEVFKQVV